MQVGVGIEDATEDGGVFELEEDGRAGEHDVFIRDQAGRVRLFTTAVLKVTKEKK
jgi:hypothetical protein